jgi:hypothetical protein
LADYSAAAGKRAFHVYDIQGDPTSLSPVDLLAPSLLDAPLRGRLVIDMYRPVGPYRRLREALEAVIQDPQARSASFAEVDLNAGTGPWSLVDTALRASDDTPHIKASKVTKILHRKVPDLVPIFDRLVAEFYGCSTLRPWTFWPMVQADVRANMALLTRLGSTVRTPDGRPVSVLRVLDIVVWEHCQGCS